MKEHIKNYLEFFGYGEQDYIPSELSGSSATDIHHIEFGRYKRDDSIENLIALTRDEHNQAHGILKKGKKRFTKKYLKDKHLKFIELFKKNEKSN